MYGKLVQLSKSIAQPLFSTYAESVLYSQLQKCSTKPAGAHKQVYRRRFFTKIRFKAAVTGSVLILCCFGGKHGILRSFIAKAYKEERDENNKEKQITLDQAIKKSRDLCQRIKVCRLAIGQDQDVGFHFSLTHFRPGPEVIKLFSCSTQLSMKF